MLLSNAIVGRKVIYTPYNGCKEHEKEEGIITDVNDVIVFVRYNGDIRSKGTYARDIEYI